MVSRPELGCSNQPGKSHFNVRCNRLFFFLYYWSHGQGWWPIRSVNGPIIADKDMYLLYSPLFSYFFPTPAFAFLVLHLPDFFSTENSGTENRVMLFPIQMREKGGRNWEMVGLIKCQNALIRINFIFELCRRVGIGLALRGHFDCSL